METTDELNIIITSASVRILIPGPEGGFVSFSLRASSLSLGSPIWFPTWSVARRNGCGFLTDDLTCDYDPEDKSSLFTARPAIFLGTPGRDGHRSGGGYKRVQEWEAGQRPSCHQDSRFGTSTSSTTRTTSNRNRTGPTGHHRWARTPLQFTSLFFLTPRLRAPTPLPTRHAGDNSTHTHSLTHNYLPASAS